MLGRFKDGKVSQLQDWQDLHDCKTNNSPDGRGEREENTLGVFLASSQTAGLDIPPSLTRGRVLYR